MRQHQSSVDTRSTFSILYLLQGNVSSWFWKPMKQCISAKISTVYQFFRFCTKVFSFSLSFQSRTLRSWLEGNLVLASHGDQSWKWKLGILTTIPANSIRVGMYLLKSKIWRYHTAWISFRSSCAVSFPGYWPFWGLKSVKDGYSYLWHFIHRREITGQFLRFLENSWDKRKLPADSCDIIPGKLNKRLRWLLCLKRDYEHIKTEQYSKIELQLLKPFER